MDKKNTYGNNSLHGQVSLDFKNKSYRQPVSTNIEKKNKGLSSENFWKHRYETPTPIGDPHKLIKK
jgi:hypothetical protein